MALLQLRPFRGMLLLLRRPGDDLAIVLLLAGMFGGKPGRHVVEMRGKATTAALKIRHGRPKGIDELLGCRLQFLEQSIVRPLANPFANRVGRVFGDRIDEPLEACAGRRDHAAQVSDHFRLACPQRLVGMGGVDQLCVFPFHHLHFLQALADNLDLRNDVLDFANTIIEVAQVERALLDRALGLLDVGAGFADRFLGELVDQRELEPRIGRDLLDFVLAVDVGLEHQIAVQRDRNRLAVAVENLEVISPRPFGAIPGPVPGLDFEMDRPTAEIAAHMTFDRLRARPAVGGIRHHAQDVADELQRGGLAGAAAADDAIEAVAELQPRTVEKAAGHRQA